MKRRLLRRLRRGRGAAGKALVVVMVEVKEGKIGRIRLRRVPDASGPTLEGAVKDGVKPGSTVQTDGWEGYGRLPELAYVHEVVRKESALGKNLLPKVNRVVALLKRWPSARCLVMTSMGDLQAHEPQSMVQGVSSTYPERFKYLKLVKAPLPYLQQMPHQGHSHLPLSHRHNPELRVPHLS